MEIKPQWIEMEGINGVLMEQKIVTTHGGGAPLLINQALYENALLWASQSRENKPYYEHRELGYNYRMGPLTAAQGSAGAVAAGSEDPHRGDLL